MAGSGGFGRSWLRAGGALAVPVAVILAGCASGAAPGAATSPSAAAAGASTGTNQPVVATPAPPSRRQVTAGDAAGDVTATACTHRGSRGWMIKGTVRNPGPKARGYAIEVAFVARTGSVVAVRTVRVHRVAPHAAAHWSAHGAAGRSAISCVIRRAQARR